MTWHHHHDGDDRILFCRAGGTDRLREDGCTLYLRWKAEVG